MDEGNVLILNLKGKFYRANERDAIILHNVMHYKLNHQVNGTVYCGFPENALVKVITRLHSLEISFRVYRPIPTDLLHIQKEELFENNQYEFFSELEEEDDAYQFISHICEMCDYASHEESRPKDVCITLDLGNADIREGFRKVKQILRERIQ